MVDKKMEGGESKDKKGKARPDTYAVLGIAALNPNVCYAAHAHLNEEAYWQIGGHGLWRTWTKHDGVALDSDIPDVERQHQFSKDPIPDLRGCQFPNPHTKDCTFQKPYALHNHPAGM